ncbi:hypothetical protein FHW69_003212 [Luteibacter sp. Sphag1AF]|uniref:hypothetical protein n=1 Tax=Luteibacter sp. Sphag1AF TaxID=2587031 RepID=UPI001607293B|nr:hypothetical protein [Luteibacter sp. Sphag1AF]MBB3228570.1 hypothetical protein [Luteibacter sp. Sphag1AF]
MMRRLLIVFLGALACFGVVHAATPLPAAQRIVVHRLGTGRGPVRVSVGIPFAPASLADPHLVRIVDEQGTEVPAHVTTMLKWYVRGGGVRAVRAQFVAQGTGADSTYYFIVGQPRTRDDAGWNYADGLEGSGAQARPAALGVLTAAWLCASQMAGPQIPATRDEPYAGYVSAQFAWAKKLPTADPTAWLFDRPSTLFKAYVRTGREDYLEAAEASYRYYMSGIRRDGFAMSPMCAGGWTYDKKPCDVKYVYIEPILLAVGLTGDDSMHDTETVDHMMTLWDNGGWNPRAGAYKAPSDYFTERLAGLGLIETVSGYELTGDPDYLAYVKKRLDWLADHQRANPDGLGNDGSWRNSWAMHENDTYDAATDVRGASPWMSENIIDGLWHAWLVTADPRIPGMISGFGRYLERYGWIAHDHLVNPHDWRNPCSGPDGQIAWYWSSAHADSHNLDTIQDSEGWYSDAHTVELGLAVAAAWYFETDPAAAAAQKRRFTALASSYAPSCAAISDTARRFNWNNRGAGVAQWMIRQPSGSGASGTRAVAVTTGVSP